MELLAWGRLKSIQCSVESWGSWHYNCSERISFRPWADDCRCPVQVPPPLGLCISGYCALVFPLDGPLGTLLVLLSPSNSYSSFLLRLQGIPVCFDRETMSLVPDKENKKGTVLPPTPPAFIELLISHQAAGRLPAHGMEVSCSCCGSFRWRLTQ